MKSKLLTILVLVFMLIPVEPIFGESNIPAQTADELEQMAQAYRNDGMLEASDAVYRQLIDMNPRNFKSVLYQHEIMLNAEARGNPRQLAEEILRTFWLLEKAIDEPFDDATTELISKEDQQFEYFLNRTLMSYYKYLEMVKYDIQEDDKYELDVWLAYICLTILNHRYHFADDGDIAKRVYKASHQRSNNFKYTQSTLDYFEHIFELYDHNIITSDMQSPLDLIKFEVEHSGFSHFDAIANVGRAFESCRIHHKTNIHRLEWCDAYTKKSLYYGYNRTCSYPYNEERNWNTSIPLQDCHQDFINSAKRVINSNNADLDKLIIQDLSEQIIHIYYRHNQYEQARPYIWKNISDNSVSITHRIYLARILINTYHYTRQFDELNPALQKLKKIPDLYTNTSTEGAELRSLIDRYDYTIKICNDPKEQVKWKIKEQCYLELNPIQENDNILIHDRDRIFKSR